MTLSEAKRSAPPMTYFTEHQFIVGTPDNCRVVTLHGGMGEPSSINGETVLASRSFNAWSVGKQGDWWEANHA